jgi:ABC-type nitrate/sulfonate/bicarbonate transport system substrate-binding protein
LAHGIAGADVIAVMKRAPSSQTASLKGVVQPVRIGFISLVDSAPLLVAREMDLFRKHGVQVECSCEVGWATIREKMGYGQLDAAHAVSGLALALGLGIGSPVLRVVAPFVFNLHGNAITLSRDLWNRGVRDATGLRKLIQSSTRRLTMAMVSSFSSHNLMLRKWLRSGGIDPDKDLRIVPLPPTQVASSLKAGLVDGFCVGEPWNSQAVEDGTGWVVATSQQLMPGHPEKALLVGEAFAQSHSEQMAGIIAALKEACAYCDRPENRRDLVKLLHGSGFFRCDEKVLARSLVGPFATGMGMQADVSDFHIFARQNANEPTVERGDWLVRELIEQHVIPSTRRAEAHRLISDCWRPLSPVKSRAKTPQLIPVTL